MIRKQTWILLGVFIIALVATIILEKNPELVKSSQAPTSSPTSPGMMLEGWQSNDITWIEILDGQGNRLRILQTTEGKWVIDSESGDSVDAGVVEEIRSQIAATRTTAYLDPGYDLEAIGLNHPAYTLTVRNIQGRESVIQIGQMTPTQTGYYVKVDNFAPIVVSKYAIDNIVDKLQRDQLISLETFATAQP